MFHYFIRHPFQCFILLVISGAGFGLITIDLYQTVDANLNFIKMDWQFAIQAGALRQLVGLIGMMSLAMFCYIVFKFCEYVLIRYMSTHFLSKRQQRKKSED
ncbi:MAG: hypothetical protein ACWIPH_00490 [Ostreibacterium sp.]